MPIHEFQCDDCGLQVEELFKSGSVPDAIPCSECGSEMRRLVSAANHTFAHQPTGPVPQNTGVKAIDHNVDRVIGRDAERKWAAIEERNKHKRAALVDARKHGLDAKPEHLVRTRDGAGEYRLVGEKERQTINARRKLADKASKAVAQQAASAGK